MKNELELINANKVPDRWTLIRDIAVLQGKLVIDGFRDLLLVPVSLGAGVLSLLKPGETPGTEFYDLLRVGRSSERWINLFGALEHAQASSSDAEIFPEYDLDEIVTRVESFIVKEYESGGVTRNAKDRLDEALNVLQKKVRSDN